MNLLPTIVDELGVVRYLGNLYPTTPVSYGWKEFGAIPSQKIIPRSEWDDLVPDEADNYHPAVDLSKTHDQDGIGMCNASSVARLVEVCRKAAGLEHVSISGGDIYRVISGGYDRGSMLEDGMERIHNVGALPTSICPYLEWRKDYGQANVRKQYRVLELAVCPTFDHFYSALIQGWFGVAGVMWYNNYKTDSKGWLPVGGAGGGGGHALMTYKPTRRGKLYGTWENNSWTGQWGLNGTCVIPEPGYRGNVGGWWVGKLVTTESGDIPAPKE